MRRSWLRTCVVSILCLCLTPFVIAQGVGYSGVLTGTVTDSSGAVVNNAQVTVEQPDRAIKRTVTTDKNGSYRVTGLPPAVYTVKIEAPNMATQTYNGVELTVGKIATLDAHLGMATVKSEVVVTGELPPVETERASQADTVSQHYIDELPINRRDYLTFTLLSPAVSDSTRVADNADYRVKQTPQSGLSFYGSNGRGNSIMVDGSEANDDAGGVRLTVSQDAVQEFQINRSNYQSDLGGASGANINIVTRSGSNHFHGTGFGFFRDSAFDARNPFAFDSALHVGDPFSLTAKGTPVQDSLSQQQFGGSFGGPIRTDRTFFFLSYEGLRRDSDASVPLLTDSSIFGPTAGETAVINGLVPLGATPVPCLTGQPALPAATCAAILTNILTVNPAASPLNAYIVNQFEANSGLFPYNGTRDLGIARLDFMANEHNQLHLRYSGGRDNESNPDLHALTGFSRGDSTEQLDHTLQAGWFHQFDATKTNEARVQYNYSRFDVLSNSQGQVGLDINGFASLGRNIFLPSLTRMSRWEFADNFTVIAGNHTVKMGAYELLRGNRTDSETFFGGRFVFGALPGGILSPCLQVPAACGLTGVNPTTLSGLNAASLGLPQFYQQGFGDRPGDATVASTNPFSSFYIQDSWKAWPNFTLNYGVRYELDSRYAPLNTAVNDWAPRVSFAWDPFKDHKTVIRGGYGIFYAPIYYQIDYVVRALADLNGNRQIAQVFVPLTGEPGNPALTSAAIFQTLFAQGLVQCTTGVPACITPANLTQFGINVTHTGPVPPLSVLFQGDPNFRNAATQQAELGIEREIAQGWTISGSYIHTHTTHLTRARDINLLSTAPVVNVFGVPTQDWRAPACIATPTLCFANPLLLQNNQYESHGGALYDAGILELRKQFTNHFSMVANYTYSKAIDDVTDYNSDYEAFNQVTMAGERAVSDFDQRHKFVFYLTAESPWKWGSSDGWHRILSDFMISPSVIANSGHPFNVLAGTDLNGDRHSTNDRFPGVGRNTGLGPAYATVNLRITRTVPIAEHANVAFVFEGFNLFNHTNFSSVNNTMQDLNSPLPTQPQCSNIGASKFLGCTSAWDMRQLQFGVRLSF